MTSKRKDYGARVRIWDAGGSVADRYTICPPASARNLMERDGTSWPCLASGPHPFHPQGFGQHSTCVTGPHLGKRIHWRELPPDAQRFARQDWPEYCPVPSNVSALDMIRLAHTISGAPGDVVGFFGDGYYLCKLQYGERKFRMYTGPYSVTVAPHGFKRATITREPSL